MFQHPDMIRFNHMKTKEFCFSIQLTYGTISGPVHGGSGGKQDTFSLNGANVRRIEGRHAEKIDQLTFYLDTNEK